ncbi:hypothetical protein MMC12_004090 [Toensbergia leucococca]|nr:hypothetical protein [Toensbergia leucococca]
MSHRATITNLSIFATATDTTGQDISASITLMHAHHTTTSLTKRIHSPLNCPPPWINFINVEARCNRTSSPQAWTMHCRPPEDHFDLDPVDTAGSCLPSEICVERVFFEIPAFFVREAYCISTQTFVRIATVLGRQSFGSVQINNRVGNMFYQNLAADAVLTGPSMTTSLLAQELHLSAYAKLASVGNVPHFGSLPNGTAGCEGCYDVELQPVPEAADLLDARVVLPVGAGPGMLFLTTVS